VCNRFELAGTLAATNKWITVPDTVHVNGDKIIVISDDSRLQLELKMVPPQQDIVKTLLKFSKTLGWEGYVIVDPTAIYAEAAFNFRGKNDRPKLGGKLKPDYEADFVVFWDPDKGLGEWGTGKNKHGVGSVQAYLYDDEKQQLVAVSKVGGGISDEDSARFADPKLYPMVWKVLFKAWTAKGSLRHPSFDRVREDKRPEDCSVTQNPRWRREE
jgi:ATP-dependent DNA ligase